MSRIHIEKVADSYPIECKVRYLNHGKRGSGNIAKIISYLYRVGEPDRIAYFELEFESGGLHTVTCNQIQKYYLKIS